MLQWEIWYVHQQYARKELNPPQPNDPSDSSRMYVIVADPTGSNTIICCPIQNSQSTTAITEVELRKGYTKCITKDCKVVSHNIFTLPRKFFDKRMGYLRGPEQIKVQTALIAVLAL